MASYSVITDKCIKDMLCVSVCQKKAIHPKTDEPGYADAKQLYINPKKCSNCGSCISVCENEAIYPVEELPDELKHFAEINAAYYKS